MKGCYKIPIGKTTVFMPLQEAKAVNNYFNKLEEQLIPRIMYNSPISEWKGSNELMSKINKFDLEGTKKDMNYLKGKGVKIHLFDIPEELQYFNLDLKYQYSNDYVNLYLHSNMDEYQVTSKLREYVEHYRYKVDREHCPTPTIQKHWDELKK